MTINFEAEFISGELTNSQNKDGVHYYNLLYESYLDKSLEISNILTKSGLKRKDKAYKEQLENRLLEEGYNYYSNSNRFSIRTPQGRIDGKKIDEIAIGEIDEFNSHTIFKFKISIILHNPSN